MNEFKFDIVQSSGSQSRMTNSDLANKVYNSLVILLVTQD